MAKRSPTKPASIDDLAPDEELTVDEEEALEEGRQNPAQRLAAAANPKSAIVQGAPAWARVPADLIIPKNVEVAFMKVPLKDGSEMVLVLWELGVRDERLARARTQGDIGTRLMDEMSKQMIRAIDGVRVDWSNPFTVEKAWEEMGAKYRSVLNVWYLKAHQLNDDERTDFFAKCVVSARAV